MNTDLWKNIRFDYQDGGITPINNSHDTGWRRYPSWVIVAHSGGKLNIETTANGKMSLQEGCAVIVRPNLSHRFLNDSGNFVSNWAHVRFTLKGEIDIAEFIDSPLVASEPEGVKIRRINRRLALLKNGKPSLKNAAGVLEQGFALLKIICELSTEKPGPNLLSPDAERIHELVCFIESHLDSLLDRDDLADRCGLSPARFHVIFNQVVGCSPMFFVRRQRMQRAQMLLSQTSKAVKDIAQKVGYSDPYTFSRAFKNTVGQAPLDYRKSVQTFSPY